MKRLPSSRDWQELDSLLSAHCDGTLDADGERRVAEILESDQDARRYYLHYLDLHLDLARRGERSRIVPMQIGDSSPSWRWQSIAAIAAMIALVGFAVLKRSGPDPAETVEREQIVEDGPVAFVSRAEDVRWNNSGVAAPGMELSSGETIDLVAGKLRLDFADGTSATFEGPARFTLFNSTSIELFSGRVIVRSDGPTPGFAVRTPDAEFVDVGTEFALAVSDSSPTQMRVIEGEVIATLLSPDNVALEERSALAGDYLSIDREAGITPAQPDPSKFPTMLAPSILPLRLRETYIEAIHNSRPIGYWRFENIEDGLVVSEVGDHSARALGTPKLEGSQNRSLVLDGDESQRGLFVETPFADFTSGEYSVELWMNAQSQQFSGLVSLVEVAATNLAEARSAPPEHRVMAIECTAGERSRWVRAPEGKIGFFHRLRSGHGKKPRQGWQHDKSQGADKGVRNSNWQRHGKREHHGHEAGKSPRDDQGTTRHWPSNHHHSGHAHSDRSNDFWSGKRDFESRVYSDSRYVPGTWHHVVAVRASDRIHLYIDGKLEASTEASTRSTPVRLQVIIGRYSLASGWLGRPFHGRIDELAIYDRALSVEEVRAHSEQAN